MLLWSKLDKTLKSAVCYQTQHIPDVLNSWQEMSFELPITKYPLKNCSQQYGTMKQRGGLEKNIYYIHSCFGGW